MFRLENYKINEQLDLYFSTVLDGNMSFKFDDEKIVKKRRKDFLNKLGIKTNKTIAPRLVHGDKILRVEKSDAGKGILNWKTAPQVDALITDDRDIRLFMLIGDCLPIILYDQEKHILGLVHAGWKGVEQYIVPKTVQEMIMEYGTKSENILAIIGPCIRRDSYRFKEVVQKNKDKIKLWEKYLIDNSDGTTSIDLASFAIDQLINCGIKKVLDCNIDTAKDKRFFSHFRDSRTKDGDIGRFVCVVGIKD